MRPVTLVLALCLATCVAVPVAAQPIPPPPAGSVEIVPPVIEPPPLLEQIKDLHARYVAVKSERDKSARMLLIAGVLAAALKFMLDLVGRLAGGKSWLPVIALGAAVPIGLLSHFAAGNGWFDSVLVAGAGPGAVFVHEIVKRFTKPKAA